MKPGRIVGRVVASQKVQSLTGIKLLLLEPTDWAGNATGGDLLVAADTVGAGAFELVFFVESRDASIAIHTQPPVDAAIVGIIDGIYVKEEQDVHR
jgi:ethanolamine utilization protein EutN